MVLIDELDMASAEPRMDPIFQNLSQDITELQGLLQFQMRFIDLLKGITKGTSPAQVSEMIYNCVQLLGFKEMRIVLFKKGLLQTLCQMKDGRQETISSQWEHSLRHDAENPILVMTQDFNKTGLSFPKLFQPNGATYTSETSYGDLIGLPILDQGELLGFLTLANPALELSQATLDPEGKLNAFALELAPIFRRAFFNEGHETDELYRLRTKLENYNLNQKQIKILEMLVRGESNKEIAQVIHLSEQGVKYHVGNLLEKFESKNRIELRGKLHQILRAPAGTA